MEGTTKTVLIHAAILVVVGVSIFLIAMAVNHWDFSKISTIQYVTNTHTVKDDFTGICVETNTADVLFAISDDETCKVVCREQDKMQHSVEVQNGILQIHMVNTRKWYEYIGISFGQPQITLYLPQSAYDSVTVDASTSDVALPRELTFENMQITVKTGDVSNFASVTQTGKIQTKTGKIWVEDIHAGALDLSVTTGHVTVRNVRCREDVTVGVSTGDTRLTDLTCKNLSSTGSTGDLSLTNVVANGKFSLERSTGDIHFTKCDAAEISVETSTGDVTGSLLSDKVYMTQTSTGRIDVPKTTTGGKCEISTDTGNIKIQTEE